VQTLVGPRAASSGNIASTTRHATSSSQSWKGSLATSRRCGNSQNCTRKRVTRPRWLR
jgi:hypothetical protein